jgi:hypothetical protein
MSVLQGGGAVGLLMSFLDDLRNVRANAILIVGSIPDHQPPEVNYMAVLENGEIKQEVHLRSGPCRGNRRLREARYSSLQVERKREREREGKRERAKGREREKERKSEREREREKEKERKGERGNERKSERERALGLRGGARDFHDPHRL